VEPHVIAMELHLPYGVTRCYKLQSNIGECTPTLSLAKQAGTWFTYPEGMEGWVDAVSVYTKMFYLSAWNNCSF